MMRADLKTGPVRSPHFALVCCASAALYCGPSEPSDEGERAFIRPDAYASDTARNSTFVPNPDFIPEKKAVGFARFGLRQEGEVIVIEGDDRTVSSGGGQFGITPDNATAIIQDVLSMYPDEFDTIQLYPAFPDLVAGGSAFYSSISNSVQGIGAQTFNGRPGFGLPAEGRLSGWSNMNDILAFSDFNNATIPKGPYYAVIAQELSHRWLMFLQYKTVSGPSDELKGRQDAHWSALVDAEGSCQDGIDWVDNGDGTYTHDGESNKGFAPFDKYAMGILPKEQIAPTFKLNEATLNGNPLNKQSHSDLPRGSRVRAVSKTVITIDEVIDQLGPRNPPAGTETPYYRAAFVLVTHPGQSRTDWEPYLTTVQEIQETFPETWKEWTGGAGAICTRVSDRCPEPLIGLESYKAIDGNDNNLGPGEAFELELALRNDGIGTAEDVRVLISVEGTGVVINQNAVMSPPIPQGGSAMLPRLSMAIHGDVGCNEIVRLRITESTKEGPRFSQIIELPVGTRTERFDALEEAPDWMVNPEGTDTASTGVWALGQTEFVSLLGEVLQPAEDHSPGNGKLSFSTGPETRGGASRNDVDRGKTTVQSPVFALRGMRDPSLAFYAWHISKDFTKQPEPEELEAGALVVRGTDDDGETWVEMARITETTTEWTRVELRIRDHLELTNKVRFRFEIEEPMVAGIDPLVEAAIDDLSIVDYLEGCMIPGEMPDAGVIDGGRVDTPMREEDEGCGCTAASTSAPRSGVWGVGLMLGLFAVARRRFW